MMTLEEMGAAMSSTFVDELPGEGDGTTTTTTTTTKNGGGGGGGKSNNEPAEQREVRGALFSLVRPTPSGGEPEIVLISREVEAMLGLCESELEDNPLAAEYLSGNVPLPGEGAAKPYAQNYGGHQFGQWAGQLGDGRAITLGEVVVPAAAAAGEEAAASSSSSSSSDDDDEAAAAAAAAAAVENKFELQLKGAGKTPYSRRGDGRAVLRSSLREFIASEAMHHLGVPTTRCLSLALTGAGVLRDVYNLNAMKMEAGAVVARVAPTFIRFGTFQLPPARGDAEAEALSAPLVDYVLRHHMPAGFCLHVISHCEQSSIPSIQGAAFN